MKSMGRGGDNPLRAPFCFSDSLNLPASNMNLVRSKQRVADHGEVFTPAWMVEAMLDLVKDETERIDSRFLEPACGSGSITRCMG